LTTVTRSGTLTVAGTTTSAATNVTVNTQTASRYGDNAFPKDGFSLSDGTNTFTAIAQDSAGRGDTNTSGVFLPATAAFVCDSPREIDALEPPAPTVSPLACRGPGRVAPVPGISWGENGNLTSDGRRAFDYDDDHRGRGSGREGKTRVLASRNQLIRITVTNAWRSEFNYDGRKERQSYEFVAGVWATLNFRNIEEIFYDCAATCCKLKKTV
jgi:hypothetical protein